MMDAPLGYFPMLFFVIGGYIVLILIMMDAPLGCLSDEVKDNVRESLNPYYDGCASWLTPTSLLKTRRVMS